LPTPLATKQIHLPDEAATNALGARLAAALQREIDALRRHGFTLALTGDLGAGKTALVRAMLRAFGVTGPVKSPTFALLEPYVVSSLDFHHFDFYRLADPRDFFAAGFRELFGPGRICVVEWPERAMGQLPTPDLTIALEVENVEPSSRLASLTAYTELGARCLSQAIKVRSADA
jgi:tRNA threonylcarbamoyladenosine biosynthesis protein TsaE